MNDDLEMGIAKAEECLSDSIYLYEGNRYEAVVNRAYYCMFKIVQTLLLDKDVYTKTHSGAKSKFHEIFLKANLLPAPLGKIFQDAFDIRQNADYEFEIEITEGSAKQTFEDATFFLKTVKEFLTKS